jgi:hypothetical protein
MAEQEEAVVYSKILSQYLLGATTNSGNIIT